MRVLLISPMPGLDPANGDITYTEGLLHHPPDGVEYVTYAEALKSGELAWVGSRKTLRPSGVSRTAAARALFVRKAHRFLAKRKATFREPILTARVSGAFDLVHVHVFSVGFLGPCPPVVVSNACPTQALYSDGERWSSRHVALATLVQSTLARVGGSRLVSARPLPAATWVLFTEYLSEFYAQLGVERSAMHIIPNTVDVALPSVAKRSNVIGFCAKSFKDKGGADVLAAFDLLRKQRPDLELEMVGHPRPDDVDDRPGVRWLGYVARETLLADVMPAWSALVYPTRFDGSPYAVIESLAVGCPVVTVPYGALPEMVPQGVAGCVARSSAPADLAGAVGEALDKHDALALGARRWFEEHFAPGEARDNLHRAYATAIARRP